MLRYCPHCRLAIRGNHAECPLCFKPLISMDSDSLELQKIVERESIEDDVYPYFSLNDDHASVVRIVRLTALALGILLVVLKALNWLRWSFAISAAIGVLLCVVLVEGYARRQQNFVLRLFATIFFGGGVGFLLSRFLFHQAYILKDSLAVLWLLGTVSILLINLTVQKRRRVVRRHLLLMGLLTLLPFLSLIIFPGTYLFVITGSLQFALWLIELLLERDAWLLMSKRRMNRLFSRLRRVFRS